MAKVMTSETIMAKSDVVEVSMKSDITGVICLEVSVPEEDTVPPKFTMSEVDGTMNTTIAEKDIATKSTWTKLTVANSSSVKSFL
jgi:hypothetical protein